MVKYLAAVARDTEGNNTHVDNEVMCRLERYRNIKIKGL